MKEEYLKNYFENELTAIKLNSNVEGSREITGRDSTNTVVEPIEDSQEYELQIKDIIKLCTDTITGSISKTNLNIIAFALMGSDYFVWDESTETGSRIAIVIFELDNPEICYPINKMNLSNWISYLQKGTKSKMQKHKWH